jgi:hypothetical protein
MGPIYGSHPIRLLYFIEPSMDLGPSSKVTLEQLLENLILGVGSGGSEEV